MFCSGCIANVHPPRDGTRLRSTARVLATVVLEMLARLETFSTGPLEVLEGRALGCDALVLDGMLPRRRFLGGSADGAVHVGGDGVVGVGVRSSALILPRKSSMRPEAPRRSMDETVMMR